jgi:hypothetical protein
MHQGHESNVADSAHLMADYGSPSGHRSPKVFRVSTHVRIATPGDARAIAEIHVTLWQEGYRGQLPTTTSRRCQLMLAKRGGRSPFSGSSCGRWSTPPHR